MFETSVYKNKKEIVMGKCKGLSYSRSSCNYVPSGRAKEKLIPSSSNGLELQEKE